ncbi:MAG: hypothetical protein IPP22_02040 [Nitrosomonas sp.]|nr:hypothetical protein [Nitrosomonas sp.]
MIRCVRLSVSMKVPATHRRVVSHFTQAGYTGAYDTEYERKGVCDLMMICEPKRGFRQVDITDRRTGSCPVQPLPMLSAGQCYSSDFG